MSLCAPPPPLHNEQEQQIKQLTTKIENLEVQNQFKADQSAVQAAHMEMLTTLRTIRAAMASSSSDNSDGGGSSKELKALKEENAALKKQTTKQSYRINHLISGMEEMQKKLEA